MKPEEEQNEITDAKNKLMQNTTDFPDNLGTRMIRKQRTNIRHSITATQKNMHTHTGRT